MSIKSLALSLCLPLVLGACASAQITQSARVSYVGPPIHTVAIAPGGGALADAIGVELFNDGVTVMDVEQTSDILGHAGISEAQIATPESYAALHAGGADAVLLVKSFITGDGIPESASVRLTSTASGEAVASLTWLNGWGGMHGSLADSTMRKNLAGAASEIGNVLLKHMK